MCGDVTNWDEETYRETILKDREIQTQTVFRTAWAPSQNPNPDSIVVASSDRSLGSYSISSIISDLPLGLGNAKAPHYFEAEPECFLQGHEGPLYDVKFYGDGEDALLLSCGDDGRIRGWRWKDCTESDVPIPLQGKHMRPVLDLVTSQHKGPWGALSPVPENNAIVVNTLSGSIYAAAGDSCAYCWDVETSQVKMVSKGHSDYLHSITARNSTNQDVVFDENQILAVVAEPLLNRFNINGEILSQIQCAPQSAFSVSLHPSGVTAVGGYGGLVDVISQFGSHSCTFRCQFEY
ncbi:hypothetical protein CsatA_019414 [Cannabis sativa]|uniref:THO complex subunit 6 n=1 Tax=Cannabis sativa TaxID=3483 RepID=A0A803NSA1_CANSA